MGEEVVRLRAYKARLPELDQSLSLSPMGEEVVRLRAYKARLPEPDYLLWEKMSFFLKTQWLCPPWQGGLVATRFQHVPKLFDRLNLNRRIK